MPTKVLTTSMQMPASLGKIFPGASYATLSVPLTQNIQPTRQTHDGAIINDNQFNSIFIQAGVNNSAAIYICNSAAAPDTVAYTNIIEFLNPGLTFTRGKEWANNRDISDLFIGAQNAVDFAIANIDAV